MVILALTKKTFFSWASVLGFDSVVEVQLSFGFDWEVGLAWAIVGLEAMDS